MAQYLFTNNAITTLASSINSSVTALSVVAGAGALFPNPGSGQQFSATLVSATNPLIKEIILVTARSGDNFTTIARGQEGTSAVSWNAGDTVMHAATAAALGNISAIGPPTSLVGLTEITGSSGKVMDAASAPAINTAIAPTWTGNHSFNGVTTLNVVVLDNTLTMNGGSVIDGTSGTIHIQTQTTSDTSNLAASNAFVHNVTASFAPLASPALTGDPTAPTAALGTATTQIATTSFVNPGSSISANGFRKNADGTIEQWGTTASGSNIVTTTFPTAFPNACFSVVFNPFSNTDWFVSAPSSSNSAFTVTLGSSGATGCWRAIGH